MDTRGEGTTALRVRCEHVALVRVHYTVLTSDDLGITFVVTGMGALWSMLRYAGYADDAALRSLYSALTTSLISLSEW